MVCPVIAPASAAAISKPQCVKPKHRVASQVKMPEGVHFGVGGRVRANCKPQIGA